MFIYYVVHTRIVITVFQMVKPPKIIYWSIKITHTDLLVRFVDHILVTVKNGAFWDSTWYNVVAVFRLFVGFCCLHQQSTSREIFLTIKS